MTLRSTLLAMALALVLAACATPLVQPTGPAMTTPELLPGQIRMADDARLPLRIWQPAGEPRAIVLGVHGFNDYSRAFEETGEFLAARGYTLYAYDQRGFGSTAQVGRWFGGMQLAADLCTVADLLRRRHPDLPVIVIAESMGAAVALVAQDRAQAGQMGCPLSSDGLILLAPAVWGRASMPVLQRGILWLAAHTVPALTLTARGLDIRATDNDAALRKLRQDPLVIKATRVDTIWGLSELMGQAQSIAPRPDLHTLIFYGERDQIIPRNAFCRWLAGVPETSGPRLAVYADGWHMLTRDLQRETVLSHIAAWLADPAAELPPGARYRSCGRGSVPG